MDFQRVSLLINTGVKIAVIQDHRLNGLLNKCVLSAFSIL